MYAQVNWDLIPLGTSLGEDATPPPVATLPGPQTPTDAQWHTAKNHFLWLHGRPSAAAGPLVASGMIKRETAQLLYCRRRSTACSSSSTRARTPGIRIRR